MTTFTQNDVLKGLMSAGVDVNDASSIKAFITACESREFLMSELGSWLVRASFGQVANAKLIKAYGKGTTVGKLLSHTEEEVKAVIPPGCFNTVLKVLEEKGNLRFSEGCIYCKSSKCVAHRYGESVCGTDHTAD